MKPNTKNMETNEKEVQVRVTFAALDPYIERNMVLPTETILRGKDMVQWGDKNIYPDYLLELSKNSPTLRSIINGTTDFILGDGQTLARQVGTYSKGGGCGPRYNNLRSPGPPGYP